MSGYTALLIALKLVSAGVDPNTATEAAVQIKNARLPRRRLRVARKPTARKAA